MLDEEVDEWDQCSKECSSQVFPQLDRSWVGRAQGEAAQCPRQRRNQIADHEDIVPIVVIRACNIGPSSASQRPENTHSCDELGQAAARAVGHAVEEEDQQEARARANGDEDLEYGALRVAVADGRADGGKPFDGIAEVLVLDDFGVVKGHAHNQGAEEGGIRGDSVEVGDPLAGYLASCQLGCRIAVGAGRL